MGIRTSICVEDSCIYANDEPYSKIIHEASPCTSPVLTYDNTYKNTQDSTSSSSKPVPITQIIMKPFTSEHNPLARKTEPRTGLLEQHRGNEVNSENGADSVVTTHISSSTEESK